MRLFYSALANYLCTAYNGLVGSEVLKLGTNLFVDDLPNTPAVAVGLFTYGVPRSPGSVIQKPEFEIVVRAEKDRAGDAMQMYDRLFGLLHRQGGVVTGFPCLIRANEEPVTTGKDTQERPLFVSRFVVWGTNLQ